MPTTNVTITNVANEGVVSSTGEVFGVGSPAGGITYAPAVPANWNPVPATAQAALDELAARPQTFLVQDSVVHNVPALGAFDVTTTESGVVPVAGDRLLLGAQTVGSQNGIYVVGPFVGVLAPLTRAADMPAGAIVPSGTVVRVAASSLLIANEWMALSYELSGNKTVVIGTTDPQFYPRSCNFNFSLAAGARIWGAGGVGELFLAAAISSIVVGRENAVGTALTTAYTAPSVTRVIGVNGVAHVAIQAEIAAGTINVADTSEVNATVTNW